MKAPSFLLAALLLGARLASAATEDVPIGFLPPAWITESLPKILTPQGRFVILAKPGAVRIIDTAAKIAAARSAIDALQNAPATISLTLNFEAISTRPVERRPAEPPSRGDGIPVPSRYSPPRVIVNPGGGVTVIPSQPLRFTTRSETSGSVVQPSAPIASTPIKQTLRRLSASSLPHQPISVPVTTRVEDAAALRALALQLGAVPPDEPAWETAGTELLIRAELTGGKLVLNVTPQVVLRAKPGQEIRRIPLSACAAGIPIPRSGAGPTGTLPRTDAAFYRLFFGTPAPAPDAVTTLTVTADVRYLGNPPPPANQ